ELEPQEAAALVTGLDAVERAGRRLRLQEVAIGDVRREVQAALLGAAVTGLGGAAVPVEDDGLDALEGAVERRAPITLHDDAQVDSPHALGAAHPEDAVQRAAVRVHGRGEDDLAGSSTGAPPRAELPARVRALGARGDDPALRAHRDARGVDRDR